MNCTHEKLYSREIVLTIQNETSNAIAHKSKHVEDCTHENLPNNKHRNNMHGEHTFLRQSPRLSHHEDGTSESGGVDAGDDVADLKDGAASLPLIVAL